MKKDKYDSIFSRYIKLLSGGYCARCGKYLGVNSRGLHCAHWQGRGRYTTRYLRDNCQTLCMGCHEYLDHHPAKKDDFFFEILGQECGLQVKELGMMTLKDFGLTKEDIQESMYKEIKPKVKLLEEMI